MKKLCLVLTVVAATGSGDLAQARSLRDGRLAEWFTDLFHPCRNPLKKVRVDYSKWVLTFADEFNGSDGSSCYTRPALCQYRAYWGVSPCPAEFQQNLAHLNKCVWSVYHFKNYMTRAFHNFSAEDVTVRNGYLELTSRARPANTVVAPPAAKDCQTSEEWTANCALSAGGVEARPYPGLIQGFAQQYGRFEVRARLPKTPGSWPAHWLMPHGGTRGWPGDGEIDIMESFHGRVQRVAFTLHWDDQGHQQKGIGCALNWGRNFSEDFHVFAIEWEPNEIRWYVDDYLIGKLKSSEKNRRGSRVQIPSLPFYWILNSSISTDGVDPRTFPVGKHYIDYVRVYRRR